MRNYLRIKIIFKYNICMYKINAGKTIKILDNVYKVIIEDKLFKFIGEV